MKYLTDIDHEIALGRLQVDALIAKLEALYLERNALLSQKKRRIPSLHSTTYPCICEYLAGKRVLHSKCRAEHKFEKVEVCSDKDCIRPIFVRKMCRVHYYQWREEGRQKQIQELKNHE